MKDFFTGIWKAPAYTFGGALAALGLWLASAELGLPETISIPAMAVAIFAGALYKPKDSDQ